MQFSSSSSNQGFDFDKNGVDDEGIIPEGYTGKISLKDAKNLTNPIQVPDGGPTVSPDPPGEGGGCGICSVPDGRGKTRNDLGAWAIAAGVALLAARRRNGAGVESTEEKYKP